MFQMQQTVSSQRPDLKNQEEYSKEEMGNVF